MMVGASTGFARRLCDAQASLRHSVFKQHLSCCRREACSLLQAACMPACTRHGRWTEVCMLMPSTARFEHVQELEVEPEERETEEENEQMKK